jgi:PAS domain S-box-containing protein
MSHELRHDTAEPVESDLAELQQVYETHLIKNEQRLREAERLARLGHWELNLQTNWLFWSDEIYRILELNPEEFEPSYEIFLKLVHPEDRQYVREQYENSVATGGQYNVYHRILLQDGSIKFVNERCKTYYDEKNTPLRSLGTILDLTDHEREIEKLMRAKAGLELYASELEIEVETLSKQLEHEKKELADARELLAALTPKS